MQCSEYQSGSHIPREKPQGPAVSPQGPGVPRPRGPHSVDVANDSSLSRSFLASRSSIRYR